MFIVKKERTGGYISDEIKLTITLDILAGRSAHDLGVIFDI